MKLTLVVLGLLACAMLASSAPVHPSTHRTVLFTRTAAPPSWKLLSRAHPSQKMTFIVALPQRNIATLEEAITRVSDPMGADYGKYLSIDEVLSIVAPDQSIVDTVIAWLRSSGVPAQALTNQGDAITVRTTVAITEKLFDCKLFNFVHTERGRLITRSFGTHSVPSAVNKHIYMVSGIADFPPVREPVRRPLTPNADDAIIPLSLFSLYNITENFNITTNSSQGVAEFQGDASYNPDDLSAFYKECGIAPQPSPTVVGAFNPSNPDIEATLDYQYITAVGQNATNWYWTEANWMYDFAVSFFSAKSVPNVISMSWGWAESDQCTIDGNNCQNMGVDSQQYVERVNTEFAKIVARGVTLVAASGDSGAPSRSNPDCSIPWLFPIFPGASPYVLSVGATQLNANVTSSTAEPVCSENACSLNGVESAVSFDVSSFTSGGGFSNYTLAPAWQQAAVSNFLNISKAKLPPSSWFNSSGRGFPDVAALGHNFVIRVSGSDMFVGGTSASSPAFAAVIAILNDYRLKNKLPVIGLAQPLLYKMAADSPNTFTDVTVGDNVCTEDGCSSGCQGFYCAKGWDPVTGLGTPNVGNMLAYLKAIDAKRQALYKN